MNIEKQIQTHLHELATEANNSLIKESCEKAIFYLRQINQSQNDLTTNFNVTISEEISKPFLLGIQTKNKNLIRISITAFTKLMNSRLTNDKIISTLFHQLRDMINTIKDQETQLKILQLIVIFVTSNPNVSEESINDSLHLCFFIYSKGTTILTNSAIATLRQICSMIFDRAVQKNETDSNLASSLFFNLCGFVQSKEVQWFKIKDIPFVIILELIEVLISTKKEIILTNPKILQVMKNELIPYLKKTFDQEEDLTLKTRKMRLFYLVLNNYYSVLTFEMKELLEVVENFYCNSKLNHKLYPLALDLLRSFFFSEDLNFSFFESLKHDDIYIKFIDQLIKISAKNSELKSVEKGFYYLNVSETVSTEPWNAINMLKMTSEVVVLVIKNIRHLLLHSLELQKQKENELTIQKVEQKRSQENNENQKNNLQNERVIHEVLIEFAKPLIVSLIQTSVNLVEFSENEKTIGLFLESLKSLIWVSGELSLEKEKDDCILKMALFCFPRELGLLKRLDNGNEDENKVQVKIEENRQKDQEITSKSLQAMKTMIEVAEDCGAVLRDSWSVAMETIELIEIMLDEQRQKKNTDFSAEIDIVRANVRMFFGNTQKQEDSSFIRIVKFLCFYFEKLQKKLDQKIKQNQSQQISISDIKPQALALNGLQEISAKDNQRLDLVWELFEGVISATISSPISALREKGLRIIFSIITQAISANDNNSEQKISPQMENKFFKTLEMETIQKNSSILFLTLENLSRLLHTVGHRITQGWATVIRILWVAAGSKDKAILASSVSSVELICSDFLRNLPPANVSSLLIPCLSMLVKQKTDINTSLTAISLFSTVCNHAARVSGEAITSTEKNLDDSKSEKSIWITVAVSLKDLSQDERPDVRNCVVQTLGTILASFGSLVGFSEWEFLIENVLVGILTSIHNKYSNELFRRNNTEQQQDIQEEILPQQLIPLSLEETNPWNKWAETFALSLREIAHVILLNCRFFQLTDFFMNSCQKIISFFEDAALQPHENLSVQSIQSFEELFSAYGCIETQTDQNNQTFSKISTPTLWKYSWSVFGRILNDFINKDHPFLMDGLKTFILVIKKVILRLGISAFTMNELKRFFRMFLLLSLTEQKKNYQLSSSYKLFPVTREILDLILVMIPEKSPQFWPVIFNLVLLPLTNIFSIQKSKNFSPFDLNTLNDNPFLENESLISNVIDPKHEKLQEENSFGNDPSKKGLLTLFAGDEVFDLDLSSPQIAATNNVYIGTYALKIVRKMYCERCPVEIAIKLSPRLLKVIMLLMLPQSYFMEIRSQNENLNEDSITNDQIRKKANKVFLSIVTHTFQELDLRGDQIKSVRDIYSFQNIVVDMIQLFVLSSQKIKLFSIKEAREEEKTQMNLFDIFKKFMFENVLKFYDENLVCKIQGILFEGAFITIPYIDLHKSSSFIVNKHFTRSKLSFKSISLIFDWIKFLSSQNLKESKLILEDLVGSLIVKTIGLLDHLINYESRSLSIPIPQNLQNTIIYLLKELKNLSLNPKYLQGTLTKNLNVIKNSNFQIPLEYNGSKFHLYFLFPILCDCMAIKNSSIQFAVSDLLHFIQIEYHHL
ncbi:protein mon2 [Anaeramoeba ignava]|uniref:Protein mon2 n=1 Tax=Anaeramoeba ignava TaxID=1746090 RepID=A0A9Q0R8F9_ANAIG|nr:protein mon2 [Anaeramoeba ignava]